MQKKKKTILIVDDAPENLDMMSELLSKYDIVDVISGKDALEVAREGSIDLILLDIVMPNMDGYEVCQILKSNPETKDIPVIFITAKIDEESIEKAYAVGGIDYITKPLKPKELIVRVKRELQLQELQRELKLLAAHDYLTKLYNRRYFAVASEHILSLSKREKKHLSVIMLDIDKFKNINDVYGHKIGDDVIIFLSDMLLEKQRKSDVVCRYGGEEFVILLAHTKIEDAKKIAEKLRRIIESSSIDVPLKDTLKFTISLGVSSVDVKNEVNIELALQRADDALYRAKKGGRNQTCIKHFENQII